MAVAYVAILPADQATSVLDDRADRLDRELVELWAQPEGVLEAHMLEVAYWRTVVAAEAAWIRKLSDMLGAILACAESLNIAQYELFSLRDADSDSGQPTGTLGIVTDTYWPKPALAVYRDVVRAAGERFAIGHP